MADKSFLARELKQLPDEPFLPIERRLVAWSVGLGVGLLALLVWISRVFFPG